MADFAEEKEQFLRDFLGLPHGLPSHDTFSRVFRALEPEAFRGCFQTFMKRFAQACQGVIAIDGKVLRRSFDAASAKSPLHMVSAWGCEQRLVLGQIATDAKSNAPPSPSLGAALKGCIVTVDARRHRQPSSKAATMPWPSPRCIVRRFLRCGLDTMTGPPAVMAIMAASKHGSRVHGHRLASGHGWPGLKAIGKIVDREQDDKGNSLLSSQYTHVPGAFGRCRPGVENKLHWVLDVTMNEDQARNRLDNGPNNLAVLRHMAINILNTCKLKISTRRKIKRAGWSNSFLTDLIAQI